MNLQVQSETAKTALPVAFFYPLFIVSAVLFAYYYWQQSTRKFKLGNKIPGPEPKPFFGNALDVVHCKTPYDVMQTALSLSNPFDKVVRIWLGSRLIVALYEPDDVEVILNSNVHLKKSKDYKYFEPWLGDGLLISHGEKWRSHRKMIAPTFHMNILKSFMDVFNKNSRAVCKAIAEEKDKCFDVHDYMSGITVDILLETAMGINRSRGDQNKAGFDYAMAVMKLCEIIHMRQFKFYLRPSFIYNMTKYKKLEEGFINIIHTLTKKVVKQKKEEYVARKKAGNTETLLEQVTRDVEEKERKEADLRNTNPEGLKGLRDDLDDIDENDVGAKKRLAFLDFMVEASHQEGMNIQDSDIKEEVDTIMFEGHDTTAAGSSFTLCMLGVHQHIQDKVMEELNSIFGDSNRACTFADTLEMKYLERVILESLRMYPPVPIIARELEEDVQIKTKNLVLPAGTTVLVAQFKIHRSPETYPNPTVFDPDNFLPERCANRHYYSFIPFSAGPRSCVGRKYALLKLKVLLSTVLRNYKVKSEVPEEEFKLQADIILKRADGFRIRMEPRKTVAT